MSVNFNRTVTVGTLTKDFELKTASSGSSYASNGLAVNRKYKTQDGQMKEEVVFVNFTIFGKMAENAAKYVGKANQVLLEGRLGNRKSDNKTELQLIVERIQFITFKPKDQQGSTAPAGNEEEVPF